MLFTFKEQREITRTTTTIGHNVEVIEYKNTLLNIWDVGGQDQLRSQWEFYLKGIHGLIYVVDSNDNGNLDLARSALNGVLLSEDMEGVPILMLANKQDKPGALTPEQVGERMGVSSLDQPHLVLGTVGWNLESLEVGIKWLVAKSKKQAKKQAKKKKKKKKKEKKIERKQHTPSPRPPPSPSSSSLGLLEPSLSSITPAPLSLIPSSSTQPESESRSAQNKEKEEEKVVWLGMAEVAQALQAPLEEVKSMVDDEDLTGGQTGSDGQWRITQQMLNVWLQGE